MTTNKKISELTELAEADLADDDLLPIVDISNNATKKVRKSTLTSALAGVSTIAATSPLAVNQSTGSVTVSTGTIPINKGGTGQTAAAAALSALGGINDPTTTRGDLLSRGASTINRIPIGSANKVLKSDGTDPEWGLVATSELSGTINLTNQVTGTLPTGKGGTGLSAIGSAGQVLTVQSGGSGLEWAEGVTASVVSLNRFSGTGSQTAFTLSTAPTSENVTQVFISGVYQQKDTYSISGTTLTFNTAPPSGTNNIEITDTGASFFGVSPAIGTVTTGAAGSNAAVSITSGGVMSFTIPRGNTGATGSTGTAGAAATIAVGSTTTGAAGSSASVANSGSSSAATFNFTIPKGDTGATGSTGTAGAAATIAVGTTTTGAAGSSATVVNGGSSSAATFNFTIPKGNTGATGSAATVAVGSTTTGNAGTNAAVANAGSSSAATLNFTIPKGDQGTAGAAATIAVGSTTTGNAGTSASVANAGSSSAATFNFTIPRGDTGAQGSQGTPGANGVFSAIASQAEAEAGSDNVKGMSSLRVKQSLDANAAPVTLAGSLDYLTLSGQEITRGAIVLTTDVSGTLPVANGGSGATSLTDGGILLGSGTGAITAMSVLSDGQMIVGDGSGDPVAESGATLRTSIGVDAAGTDNSTNVTLAGSLDYLTISGQEITRGAIVLTTDVSGTLPVANGGSGATSLTDGGILLGSGTGAITAMSVLANGEMIVGDGTTDPVAESGATLRTSIGVDAAGTDNSTNVTLAGSLDYLTLSGQEITRGAIVLTTDVSGTLPIANGGTNATSAGAALTSLGAAARGANSDITSITGLTTDLTVAQGGTGAGTFAANGILFGNGTSAIGATAVGTDGHVLTSNGSGSAPTFQAAGGGGASDINGLSDGVTNSSGATVGLGTDALANDDGSERKNTALGFNALKTTNSNKECTAVGYKAGTALTGTGDANNAKANSFFGFQAGVAITTGLGNTIIGAGIAPSATTPNNLTIVGKEAGEDLTTGGLTAFGVGAGYTTTTGNNVGCFGNGAIASSATASNEITLGNTSVTKFRIPGINWSIKDTTATDNYVLTVDANGEAGWEAGGATNINGLSDAVTYGTNSIGLGNDALSSLNGEHGCIALGEDALKDNTSGVHNIGIGDKAGHNITTGAANTVIGYEAGQSLITGTNNIFIGAEAGNYALGGYNVAIGNNAHRGGNPTSDVTADFNVSMGHNALSVVTTGGSNTVVGTSAGNIISTGANNICIGRNSDPSGATASNEVTFGDSAISAIRCQVQSISSLSDRRDKKDIEELPLGVDFINTLKPVKFTWNMRDGAKIGQQEAGFIAQDLDEAQIDADAEDYLSLVLKDNPEKLEASYGKLVPVLVKAVQQLSAEIAALKKEIKNGK